MTSELTRQFISVFESLRGTAYVVSDWSAAAHKASEICRETQAGCVAVGDLPDAFTHVFGEIEGGVSNVLTAPYAAESVPASIDGAQVGIGGAAFGIAESATMVELAEDDALRLVSALPRTYIGIVESGEIVPRLKDAAPRIRQYYLDNPENAVVSFISGPSRTGDIEMILTLGVHGPEHAYAIIVDSTGDSQG